MDGFPRPVESKYAPSVVSLCGVIRMDPKKTGSFIQNARKELRITQTELSLRLDVTNKAVSKWETGEGFPDIQILPRLADVLGVTVDDILAGERLSRIEAPDMRLMKKLENAMVITYAVLVAALVLFLGLTYSTYKVWIGVSVAAVLVIGALVFLFITRNNHMAHATYDDADKAALFETKRKAVTTVAMITAAILVQIIWIAQSDQWTNGVAPFVPYALVSSILAIMTYLAVCLLFQNQARKEGLPYRLSKTLVIVLVILLVSVLGFGVHVQLYHLVIIGLLVLFYLARPLINERNKASWTMFAGRLATILLVAAGIVVLAGADNDQVIFWIPVAVASLWLLTLIATLAFKVSRKTLTSIKGYVTESLVLVFYVGLDLLTMRIPGLLGIVISIVLLALLGLYVKHLVGSD
jgi:transcriptional regulator with XRE-family HTH domain